MSEKKTSWTFLDTSVEHSFAWSLGLTLLPVAASFVVSWAIARFAGPSVWGTVSWAMALATTLLIAAKLGVDLGASRLASEMGVRKPGELRPLLRASTEIRIVATVIVATLSLIFAAPVARWFGDGSLVHAVRVCAAIVVCASLYEFQEQFLIGLNRMATVSSVRSVTLALRVVFTVALVALGLGATAILGGYIVAWAIGIVALALMLRRYLPPSNADVDTAALRRRLLAISIPLAISSASVTVYSQMDKLMLGYFDTVEEVGQYSIARAVTEVSLFPSFALVIALRPALASRFSAGALSACASLIRRSLRVSLVAGVLFASVFLVFAVPLFTFVYGKEYSYAGGLMYAFAGVIVLRSAGALVLPALVAADRNKPYAYFTTLCAVINFGLNLVLIPRMHSAGAIYATVVSYAVLLFLGLREVFRVFHVRAGARAVGLAARTFLAGIVSAGVFWLIRERVLSGASGWWTVALVATHAAFYIALVMAAGVIRVADVHAVSGNMLKRKG